MIIWMVFAAGWLAGRLLLYAVPLCRGGASAGGPPLSVIIPARNEERNLPRLLESLTSQIPPPDEILVVDDGSTDRTADIAREAGARVLTPAGLPPGWRGKAWACRQGAQAAAHGVLLFLDADTWFEPGGLSALRAAHGRAGGALSLAAFHRTERPYEQLSAFFNWVMTAATGAFTPRRRAQGLFGPCLMVARTDYERVGGHDAVKNRVLENYFLAAEFRRAGVTPSCFGGKGVLSIRMYPGGLRELAAGWGKAFASGAGRTPPLLLAGIIAWLSAAAGTAVMLPVAALTEYSILPWAALYLLFALQMAAQWRGLGTFGWRTALLYPVPLVFFFALFARSAFRKQSSWKGRTFREKDEAC